MLTNKESDWQMIRERQILYSIMGMPEKDVWEDRQHDQMTGNDVLIKSVKAEQNAESVKSSPTCATKYMSGGGGRSRQNLTEAEKEARRLRRILANRESARQTIRRRQALCEKLTLKVADLTRENENLKRAKELALKEYKSQESTNKHLKAQMVKAIKAEEGEAPRELKLAHQISGPSRNYPFYFYNQHPFPPFCWPSIVQSSNPVQTQCEHQNAIVVSSSISAPTNGRLDSSHDQENPINVNGPKTPLYVVPYPWFFSLPDHGNELHLRPCCGPKNNKDETSANNRFSAGCSLKSVVHEEKYNFSLPTEVEKEAYGSIEASSNNQNCTSVRLPSDGSVQCIRYQIKEEVILPTPLCSAGPTFVVEQENTPDVNTEAARVRACHFVGALPEENQESTNYTTKKVLDAAAAAEARKRRKELTKLKNLHGRQCRTHR
ncbi:Basic-leucine zipper transcription factor family protein, putative isoform 2 [Theobroma cacao]|nr:Basic-leucine zipper transcription factor family protein, putative isoform 2 [Theobroma cacao]